VRLSLLLSTLALTTLAACDDFSYEGWLNEPIPIRVDNGIPLVQIRYAGADPVLATIDTGSPLTAINARAQAFDMPEDGPLAGFDLLVGLGETGGELRLQDGDSPDVTRFVFRGLPIVDVPLQPVGLGQPTAIGGLLGATLLSRFTVRLEHQPPQLTLSDSVADSAGDLAADCRAANLVLPGGFASERCIGVFRTAANGGGTMLLGNSELSLSPSRLTVSLCVAPDAFDPTAARPSVVKTSGVPLSGLLSTGLGTSIISRSAFERLRAQMPELTETPRQTLYLQTGPLSVSTTEIPRIAVVDDRTLGLGPCGELARRRRLAVAPTIGIESGDESREGAAAAIAERSITFAIVADDAGILQGLRQELRALVADVEVVLGGSFFERFVTDIDYPNGRTLLQCASGLDGAACRVYPACNGTDGPSCPTRTDVQ
jgi:hypothetical protein